MRKTKLLFRLLALVACIMCALGVRAAEAYACYTSSNTTLTFYYDNQRSSRTGTTYDLNTGYNDPAWAGISSRVTRVQFNSSFANAHPTTTYRWFYNMYNVQYIMGTEQLNTSYVTNMADMFAYCSSLTTLTVSPLITGNVTDMSNMFYKCNALTSLNLSNFNTSKVTKMDGMFNECARLKSLDLSGFNTAKVTDMNRMFQNCGSLESINLTGVNTNRVTNMSYMFSGCTSLTSIIRLNGLYTGNVTDMSYMFDGCRGLTTLNLRDFNTAKVTNMSRMFNNCSGLTRLDVGRFNTSLVTNMSGMFSGCTGLFAIYVIDGWSTAAVTSSSNMFYNCTSLVGGMGTAYDANHVDAAYAHIDGGTSNPGYFSELVVEAYACYTPSNTTLTFYYDNQRSVRTGTTYDLNKLSKPEWFIDSTYVSVTRAVFDPSFASARPTSTNSWFFGMTNLQSITGISYLNTSEVTSMGSMFFACESLTSLDLSGFNTAKVIGMSEMFERCYSLTSLDLSSFNTSNVTNMLSMFRSCIGLTSLDLSNFNTANVTKMNCMFLACRNLTSLDVSSFNTANVKNMYGMFYGCYGLTSLDLSHFNTANVTNMSYMFENCYSLTSLDLSSFNTANVTDMRYMFRSSGVLTTIYAGDGWSTAAVTESTEMFKNCTALVGGKGTTYDASHVDAAYAHIDGGTSNPGYFTKSPTEAYACYSPDNLTLTFYYDGKRASRSGKTYDLNMGSDEPGWCSDGTYSSVTRVVFDPSFASARPTSTSHWFDGMFSMQSITGMAAYLNTTEVTIMNYMFLGCSGLTSLDLSGFVTSNVTTMSYMFQACRGLTSLDLSNFNTANVTSMTGMFLLCDGLTSLDLSNFNTSKVTDMSGMFQNCFGLKTIYSGDGWSTAAVTSSGSMFYNCTSLVGGMGTTYSSSHTNAAYAHIDGGPSNPGYFTAKNASLRGDVDADGSVTISDVTALIDYLLSDNASGVNLTAADCDLDGSITISDVTALIDYLLSGSW